MMFSFTLQLLCDGIAEKNVMINACHPGTCQTDFFRYYLPLPEVLMKVLSMLLFPVNYLTRSSLEGAQTIIYAAVDENAEGLSGKYLM